MYISAEVEAANPASVTPPKNRKKHCRVVLQDIADKSSDGWDIKSLHCFLYFNTKVERKRG